MNKNKIVIGVIIIIMVLLGSWFLLRDTARTPTDLGEGPWESFMARLGSTLGVRSDFSPHILRVSPNPIDQNNCNEGSEEDLCRFVVIVSNNYQRYQGGRNTNFSYLIVNAEEVSNIWSPGWGENILIVSPTFLSDNEIQFDLNKNLIFNKIKIRAVNYVNGGVFFSDEYIVESLGVPITPEIMQIRNLEDSGDVIITGENFNPKRPEDNDSPVMSLFAGVLQNNRDTNIIQIPFDYRDSETIIIEEDDILSLGARNLFFIAVNLSPEEGQYAISDRHRFNFSRISSFCSRYKRCGRRRRAPVCIRCHHCRIDYIFAKTFNCDIISGWIKT